jgi:hypothetical protein
MGDDKAYYTKVMNTIVDLLNAIDERYRFTTWFHTGLDTPVTHTFSFLVRDLKEEENYTIFKCVKVIKQHEIVHKRIVELEFLRECLKSMVLHLLDMNLDLVKQEPTRKFISKLLIKL